MFPAVLSAHRVFKGARARSLVKPLAGGYCTKSGASGSALQRNQKPNQLEVDCLKKKSEDVKFERPSQADGNETLDSLLKIQVVDSFREFQRKEDFRSIFMYFWLTVFVASCQEATNSLGMDTSRNACVSPSQGRQSLKSDV